MASEAQIAANRRNAQASTGPKTASGKVNSRSNAERHGLASPNPVALGEDEADFLRYCDALAHSLDPQNAVEAALVQRAALCGWRLERLYRIEAAFLDNSSRIVARVYGRGDEVPLNVWPHEMSAIARYEAMLDRSFRAALNELQKLRGGKMSLRPILHVEKPEPEQAPGPEQAAEPPLDNAAPGERAAASGEGSGEGFPPVPAIEPEITKRTQFEGAVAEIRGDMHPP